MPLPKPQTGESLDAFRQRCGESDELKEQFPDAGTRKSILERIHEAAQSAEAKRRDVFEFELKDVDEERGTFAGHGSTFNDIDHGDDRVMPGAFTDTLKEFKAKDQLPAMFWLHDWKQPIGEWTKMVEDKKGLAVEGALWVNGNTLGRTPIEKSEQVRNLLTSNGPKGLSIGYQAQEFEFVQEDAKAGRLVRNLNKVGLFEVSPVPFGMNPEATVTAAKSFGGELPTKRELETILRDAGLSRKSALSIVAGGYDRLAVRDSGPDAVALISQLAKNMEV